MPTIIARDRRDAARIATKLLRAAGAQVELVRRVTAGASPAFDVPDDVYAKFVDGEGDKGEVEQSESQGTEPATPADTAPLVGGEPVIDTGDDDPIDVTEGAVELEVPDRNDSTTDYMRARFGIDTEGMKRGALIAEYDRRTETAGE